MEKMSGKWDRHLDKMMNKASKRMCILRVCKHYGLTTHQLDFLFNSLIVSVFTFAPEHRTFEASNFIIGDPRKYTIVLYTRVQENSPPGKF